MRGKKWDVSRKDEDTLVVERVGHTPRHRVDVWLVLGDDDPRCTACTGKLAAMSGSCLHVAAAKRFLKAEHAQ